MESLRLRDVNDGNIGAVILTGLTVGSIRSISKYVDRTSDIQTAALLAAFVETFACTGPNEYTGRWIIEYEDLLNRLQLWEQRAVFTIKRTEMRQAFVGPKWTNEELKQAIPAQSSAISMAKTKPVNAAKSIGAYPFGPQDSPVVCSTCRQTVDAAGTKRPVADLQQPRDEGPTVDSCPACGSQLPRCAICLFPLGTVNSFLSGPSSVELMNGFVWCQKCGHGGHGPHVEEWFAGHETCPVPECDCQCVYEGKA